MPTYEYKCNECENLFEKFQNITDEPVKTCPSCQGSVTRLLSGGGGIIFKGSGFYHTDYKKSACRTHEEKMPCKEPKNKYCSGCEKAES